MYAGNPKVMHPDSKQRYYFLHKLAKFCGHLYLWWWWWWWCVCRGNIWPPSIPMSLNFHDFAEQCLSIVSFQKITFKPGSFTDFKAFFPAMLTVYRSLVLVKILKTGLSLRFQVAGQIQQVGGESNG